MPSCPTCVQMRIPRSTPWCCCRTRPWSRCWCGCDGESIGERQPGDEVGVDRGSRGGVVFANRGAAGVRHEEVIPRQRESVGVVQPGDEVGVDRGSRDSVVLSNHIAVVVRHEETVARQHESPGSFSPAMKLALITAPVVASYSPILSLPT
jgi:hypothetical protein